MQIAIYTRDDEGLVTCHGDEDWESAKQALEYYCRDNEPAEVEQLIGWPHSMVTWHGDIGIAQ